ncbi:DUF302 domain-containing protein [bacterium]|nr:DUF302 domain-containing protein [bacterium]
MKKFLLFLACAITLSANELIIKQSKYGVSQTIQNIKEIVTKEGMGVFAIINHHGNAGMVGMEMREAKLIIFGNPKMGTKLMQENILLGLDLPMKVLVFRDKDEKVKLAYRNASWLKDAHALKNETLIQEADKRLDDITDKASK